ncbi:MAG: flagellar basal body-associated protein FliL [Betaproteobacteria bacterium]|nr:flagellar basal body-associated protein FliL [Betaproteobacteria bacterium]
MAKANVKPAPEIKEPEQAPKKKKGGFLVILIVLLLLGGGGAAAWYFLFYHPGAKPQAAKAAPPVFQRLDTFTTNLAGPEAHYLQADITLQIADAKVGDGISTRMPEVRNAILQIMRSKRASDLATPNGTKQLADQIKGAVNQILGAHGPSQGVTDVLFTNFVIQ